MLAQGYSSSSSMASSTIYTVPAGKSAIIKTLGFSNKSGTDQALEVRIVPSGATAGNQHIWISEGTTGALRSTAAGATVRYESVITLSAGDFIQIANTTANAVGYFIMGVEIS